MKGIFKCEDLSDDDGVHAAKRQNNTAYIWYGV